MSSRRTKASSAVSKPSTDAIWRKPAINSAPRKKTLAVAGVGRRRMASRDDSSTCSSASIARRIGSNSARWAAGSKSSPWGYAERDMGPKLTHPMDDSTRQRLNAVNRDFNTQHAGTFARTRNHPWPGWERALRAGPQEEPLRVLDVGCGNGRFGHFLAEQAGRRIAYTGVDLSPALLEEDAGARPRRFSRSRSSMPTGCGSHRNRRCQRDLLGSSWPTGCCTTFPLTRKRKELLGSHGPAPFTRRDPGCDLLALWRTRVGYALIATGFFPSPPTRRLPPSSTPKQLRSR